jgi:hypothetical protein
MPSDDPNVSTSAVICSQICENIFDGLEVLYRGIQNERGIFYVFDIILVSYNP